MAAPIKRVIKDYNSLSQEHIDLINEHFPNGFENENLISFVRSEEHTSELQSQR